MLTCLPKCLVESRVMVGGRWPLLPQAHVRYRNDHWTVPYPKEDRCS